MSSKRFISFIILLFLLCSCQQSNEQLLRHAINFSNQGKYDKAIEIYTKVIKRNNKLQSAYYNRGLDYMAIKKYDKAFFDFNKTISLQQIGNYIITYSDFLNTEETRTQVPYTDVLYQLAQVKYHLDSLKSSFLDFQTLVDANYEQKSNCLLWQGLIYLSSANPEKACEYFDTANRFATTLEDRKEVAEMKRTYCGNAGSDK